MANGVIRELNRRTVAELNWLTTENYVLDSRLAELEKEERLIDAMHPPFVYRVPGVSPLYIVKGLY